MAGMVDSATNAVNQGVSATTSTVRSVFNGLKTIAPVASVVMVTGLLVLGGPASAWAATSTGLTTIGTGAVNALSASTAAIAPLLPSASAAAPAAAAAVAPGFVL